MEPGTLRLDDSHEGVCEKMPFCDSPECLWRGVFLFNGALHAADNHGAEDSLRVVCERIATDSWILTINPEVAASESEVVEALGQSLWQLCRQNDAREWADVSHTRFGELTINQVGSAHCALRGSISSAAVPAFRERGILGIGRACLLTLVLASLGPIGLGVVAKSLSWPQLSSFLASIGTTAVSCFLAIRIFTFLTWTRAIDIEGVAILHQLCESVAGRIKQP